jgi:predicted permease
LLICAGLLLRSLQNAESMNPGFNTRNVLLATLDMYPNGYSPETGRQFYARVLERVAALPGVESASLARRIPLGFGGSSSTSFEPEGYQPQKDENVWAFYNNTSPGYFQTMQVPILRGRDFTERDADAAPRAVVINDALAARYWPGLDPIGKRIRLGGESLTVIGVVGNFKVRGLNEEPWPALFLSLLQYYRPDTTLHVRTKGDPAAFAADLRAAVQALDPNLPLFSVRTLEDHTGAATFVHRLGGSMLGAFGGLALLLAAIGVYGVVSFGVSQRTREIGIRMALGASRRDIFRLVVGQGTRLALIGMSAGLVLALGVTHFLEKVLFNVSARDPLTIGGVMVLLAASALLACYLPARRATKVDPMVALRYE